MRFTFVKVPRHRKFQHEPIYYDVVKEERDERLRLIKGELGVELEEDEEVSTEQRVRGKMKRKIRNHIELVRSEKRKSNLRLVVIIFALLLLVSYLVRSSTEWYDALLRP